MVSIATNTTHVATVNLNASFRDQWKHIPCMKERERERSIHAGFKLRPSQCWSKAHTNWLTGTLALMYRMKSKWHVPMLDTLFLWLQDFQTEGGNKKATCLCSGVMFQVNPYRCHCLLVTISCQYTALCLMEYSNCVSFNLPLPLLRLMCPELLQFLSRGIVLILSVQLQTYH